MKHCRSNFVKDILRREQAMIDEMNGPFLDRKGFKPALARFAILAAFGLMLGAAVGFGF